MLIAYIREIHMFEFQFEISKEDYLAFNKHHIYQTLYKKKRNHKSLILLFVCCMLFGVAFIINPSIFATRREWIFVVIGVITFILLHFFPSFFFWLQKRGFKNLEKDGKLYDEGSFIYRFEEEMFTCVSKTLKIESNYTELERVEIGESAVYLYIGAMKAYIFPNRIFATDEEKKNFLAFVREKIAWPKKKLTTTASPNT